MTLCTGTLNSAVPPKWKRMMRTVSTPRVPSIALSFGGFAGGVNSGVLSLTRGVDFSAFSTSADMRMVIKVLVKVRKSLQLLQVVSK